MPGGELEELAQLAPCLKTQHSIDNGHVLSHMHILSIVRQLLSPVLCHVCFGGNRSHRQPFRIRLPVDPTLMVPALPLASSAPGVRTISSVSHFQLKCQKGQPRNLCRNTLPKFFRARRRSLSAEERSGDGEVDIQADALDASVKAVSDSESKAATWCLMVVLCLWGM